jgi:hypothetical protein
MLSRIYPSNVNGPGTFPMSLAAAIKLKLPVRESRGDLRTTLLNDVIVLGYAGRGVLRALPQQPSQDELYAYRVFYTEGLYHHIYNVMTTAAVLLGQAAAPTIRAKSLSSLRKAIAKNPSHPLERTLRRHERMLDLLDWLASVRHKSVVHRAEAGYTENTAVFDETHFAFCRIPPTETDAAKLRRAADYERGLTLRFGPWNRRANDVREAVTILDLASHELLDSAPAEFDACRRLVRDAACYDLVVSHPFLENADRALTTLIETIPIEPAG